MRKKFDRTGRYCVYILKCRDGTYYTGCTNDLPKRIREHNNSKRGAKYLRGRLPVELVYAKEYRYYRNALHAERRIKALPRKRKEELIGIYEKTKEE